MGKDRNQRSGKKASGRDSGSFVALPWAVLDADAYKKLSHPARSLLIEFARQYRSDNNGRLIASCRYLKTRGWNSADVIARAKKELVDGGFIFLTVQGHRPNKANWYAITWQDLDPNPKYDPGTMQRWPSYRSGYIRFKSKINSVSPRGRIAEDMIAPSDGLTVLPTNPSSGAIKNIFIASANPPDGNHLEIPSAGVVSQFIRCESAANSSSISSQMGCG